MGSYIFLYNRDTSTIKFNMKIQLYLLAIFTFCISLGHSREHFCNIQAKVDICEKCREYKNNAFTMEECCWYGSYYYPCETLWIKLWRSDYIKNKNKNRGGASIYTAELVWSYFW